jgi:hypothetical protein
MKPRLVFGSLLLLISLLPLAPAAVASDTWHVDGVNGSDNNHCKSRQHACKTIGHAISLASGGDTIEVGPATYTENLTVNFGLKIIGSGASTTIIDGGRTNTVVTTSGGPITFSKFTIRNGSAKSGGGIVNQGNLTINDSTVSGNTAGGGGLFSPCGGGGILNDGFGGLTINSSTITNNQAVFGGGICNRGTLTLNGSTLNGNRASIGFACGEVRGGGIAQISGHLTINSSTLTANTATSSDGDYCYDHAYGGGISGGSQSTLTISNSTINDNLVNGRYGGAGGGIAGAATLQNSIVANSSFGNCFGTMTSSGYNLSSDNTCNFNSPGDLNNIDPRLGPLGNHGGSTQTDPLLSGSPAIDAGNPNGCTDGNGKLLKTDQRAKPRPDKEDTGGCDMGAYERQSD